jgi:hypothetical protein
MDPDCRNFLVIRIDEKLPPGTNLIRSEILSFGKSYWRNFALSETSYPSQEEEDPREPRSTD